MLTSAAERFTGDVAIGAAGTMNFDQIANADYGGILTGSGTLLKTGGGLLQLSANSGDFAGATTIAAGTLRLTNKLGGTMDVLANARLEGDGEVGSTVVRLRRSQGARRRRCDHCHARGQRQRRSGNRLAFEVDVTPALGVTSSRPPAAPTSRAARHGERRCGGYAVASRRTILSRCRRPHGHVRGSRRGPAVCRSSWPMMATMRSSTRPQ